MRRLLTYSVYQFPVFGASDVGALRSILVTHCDIYAEGFTRGLNALWPRPVATLIGARHAELNQSIRRAVKALKRRTISVVANIAAKAESS